MISGPGSIGRVPIVEDGEILGGMTRTRPQMRVSEISPCAAEQNAGGRAAEFARIASRRYQPVERRLVPCSRSVECGHDRVPI